MGQINEVVLYPGGVLGQWVRGFLGHCLVWCLHLAMWSPWKSIQLYISVLFSVSLLYFNEMFENILIKYLATLMEEVGKMGGRRKQQDETRHACWVPEWIIHFPSEGGRGQAWDGGRGGAIQHHPAVCTRALASGPTEPSATLLPSLTPHQWHSFYPRQSLHLEDLFFQIHTWLTPFKSLSKHHLLQRTIHGHLFKITNPLQSCALSDLRRCTAMCS